MPTVEERLAALEARMAAWIDQQPTTYYEHQYSGEEIDAAVGRALTGGALDTSVTNISNQLGTFTRPNLLDNWYFRNPVNQRGKGEYTEDNKYCIDRFIAHNLNVNVSNSCLKLSSAQYWYSHVSQKIEPQLLNTLCGKQVTMSAFFKTSKAGQVKFSLYDSTGNISLDTEKIESTTGDIQLTTATFTIPSSYSNHDVQALFYPDISMIGQETELYALKLELGSTQTLAHQENGVWVMNEVPEYGDQLRRCQMDLFKIGDAVRYCSLGNGVARDGQFVSITIPTPVTMRTMPVLIAPPVGFAMRHSDTILSGGASFSVDAFSQNSIMLKVQSQVALTPGDMWEAFLQPNGSLVFSAEL